MQPRLLSLHPDDSPQPPSLQELTQNVFLSSSWQGAAGLNGHNGHKGAKGDRGLQGQKGKPVSSREGCGSFGRQKEALCLS